MTAALSLSVEHVEASAQGGRLHLMAILKAQTRLFSDEPLSVVTGVQGAEGLMLKTETLSCLSAAASGAREVLVREECELADVLQIADPLYATAFAGRDGRRGKSHRFRQYSFGSRSSQQHALPPRGSHPAYAAL